MAATRPNAVASSASAMPGATTARFVVCAFEMPMKLFMMPQTVPNRPTNGAVAPMVASTPVPRVMLRPRATSIRSSRDAMRARMPSRSMPSPDNLQFENRRPQQLVRPALWSCRARARPRRAMRDRRQRLQRAARAAAWRATARSTWRARPSRSRSRRTAARSSPPSRPSRPLRYMPHGLRSRGRSRVDRDVLRRRGSQTAASTRAATARSWQRARPGIGNASEQRRRSHH